MNEHGDSVSISSELIAGMLTRAGLRHALIGDQAVNLYSRYRTTDDFDLCVAPGPAAIARFEQELESAGLHVDRKQNPTAASGPDFLRMANPTNTLIVDMQTAKTEFQLSVIARARPSTSGLSVATVEDLIILKLVAMRSQDQRDLALLLAWNDLDWPYIEHWADVWEVTARLRQVRDAQGEQLP